MPTEPDAAVPAGTGPTDVRLGALVDELGRHRRNFVDFCRSLSEEELARPVPDSVWTVKGYAAHLATIDRTVQPWFEGLLASPGAAPAGGGAAAGERFDIDTWNEKQVARRQDWPLERILAEMEETRAALEPVLQSFTPKTLDATMHFGGDRNRRPAVVNVYQYLRAWVRHDAAHALDMLRALPERRDDPSVKGWLEGVRFDDLSSEIVPQTDDR